jgi:AraC family transcriptional regulator
MLSGQAEFNRVVSRPQYSIRHARLQRCRFEPHAHSEYTVTAILSGGISTVIGGESGQLVEGSVGLIGAGTTHSGTSEFVEFLSVKLSPIFVTEIVAEAGLVRSTPEVEFRATFVTDPDVVFVARSLALELAAEQPGHEAMLDALVNQLVIRLVRAHMTVRKSLRLELSRAGPVDRRLRRAIEFLHDNFAREVTLDEMAGAAYLSAFHFARLFKQITGVTPHSYLANLRIERARKLLVETSYSINEIAAMVGYQSQSHFTKIFKSVTGTTPSSYRGRDA